MFFFIELQKKHVDLEELIVDLAKTGRLLTEQDEVSDPKQILLLLNSKIFSVFRILNRNEAYTQWIRLETLPDTLIIQFKRFHIEVNPNGVPKPVKIQIPIEFPGLDKLLGTSTDPNLPEPGILDLTRYYDAPEGESVDARYEIVSYITHTGSLSNGHYKSYIKTMQEDGQDIYWCCDDIGGNTQITRKEFLTNTDAYIVIFKRLQASQVQ